MSHNSAINGVSLRHDAEDLATLFPALMLDAEKIAHTVASGIHGRRRAGPGETFWQHRPFLTGDSVSAIDWRQSARGADRLFVRQNEWEAAAALWVWRDGSKSLQYSSSKKTPTKRWRADVLTTALAMLVAEAGERIGLLSEDMKPFQGRNAPARFLEALLSATQHSDDGRPVLARVPAGVKVLFVSDFFTDIAHIEKAAHHYASLGAQGGFLQVVDPSEEDFPFRGRTEFQDLESEDRLMFGEAGAIAGKYRLAYDAHRERLALLAKRLGWTMITHRTDRAAQQSLLSLYAAFGDRKALA